MLSYEPRMKGNSTFYMNISGKKSFVHDGYRICKMLIKNKTENEFLAKLWTIVKRILDFMRRQ